MTHLISHSLLRPLETVVNICVNICPVYKHICSVVIWCTECWFCFPPAVDRIKKDQQIYQSFMNLLLHSPLFSLLSSYLLHQGFPNLVLGTPKGGTFCFFALALHCWFQIINWSSSFDHLNQLCSVWAKHAPHGVLRTEFGKRCSTHKNIMVLNSTR